MHIQKTEKKITDVIISQKEHPTAKLVEYDNSIISKAIKFDTPVRTYDKEKYDACIFVLVSNLSVSVGVGKDFTSKELQHVNLQLQGIISEKYKHLTFKEIQLAFTEGISGEYGEVYGFNLKTCLHFLKSYDEKRKRHIAKVQTQQDLQRLALDEKLWECKKLKEFVNKIRSNYPDMLIHPKYEQINGKMHAFYRHVYKNCHVDVLEINEKIYARKKGDNKWRKVEDIEKVKTYLIENG